MASLRDLGDRCALVLSLYDGQHFIPPPDSNVNKLIVVASLDSRETLTSDAVEFSHENPEFNTELVWTMDRLTFQALRSRKAQLKVQVVEEASKRVIGLDLLDLREAIPKAVVEENESYVIHASWRKLKVFDLPPGREAPCIRAALVVEPTEEAPEDELKDMDDQQTMVGIDEDLNSSQAESQHGTLSPILNNEKGYFTIGCKNLPNSQIFLFNIFICFASNVHEAFPKDDKVGDNVKLCFVYDLFGTQITSKPFTCAKIHQFNPERATAKIYTSPDVLVQFFNEKMTNFRIRIIDEKEHILAEAHVPKLFNLNMTELESGKLAVFEKIVPLEPTPATDLPWRDTSKALSDSVLNGPHIGVRLSIGIHPDAGLEIKPAKDPKQVSKENIDASEVLWAPIPPKTGPSSKSEDFSKRMEEVPSKLREEIDATVMSDHSGILIDSSKPTSNFSEPVLRYKFTIDLKEITLRLDHSINCVIKYKYKPFCATEVSTWPSFQIDPSIASEPLEIRRGFCEYSFTAKESAIKKPLQKHPLHLRVYDLETLLGTASVNLSSLFNRGSGSVEFRTCSVQAPILKKNQKGSADLIGSIFCTFTIKELPPTGLSIPSPKSAFNPLAAKNQSAPEVDKVALEMEQWKLRQKETFKNQLQSLECHHINTLTKEWEKREKERENFLHKKQTEVLSLEKELKLALEECKKEKKELEAFEKDLNARELKLKEREQRLQTLMGKTSSGKKIAPADLVKENDKLKTEVEIWKTKYEGVTALSHEMASLKKEVAKLRSENLALQKAKLSSEEKTLQVTKIRDFYKNAFEETEAKVKLLQQEKDKTLICQVATLKEENAKLKAEGEKSRESYEAKIMRMAMKLVDQPTLGPNDEEESSTTSAQITVVNAKNKSEIMRLKSQRELFLNTKVYKEGDDIIKLIDAKLNELSKS